MWTIGVVVRMSTLDTKVDGSNPSISMFSPWARDFIRIASVDSAVKWVPGGDNLVKGVQCYELFWGIALKIHTFSFFSFSFSTVTAALHHQMSQLCCIWSHHTPATLVLLHSSFVFSIDLLTVRQHLAVAPFLLLPLLCANIIQMMSGVPHHCHH